MRRHPNIKAQSSLRIEPSIIKGIVIANEVKQSSARARHLDCFTSFAMTIDRVMVLRALSIGLMMAFCLTEIGCRGYTSSEPPFHVNPNMDTQDKGKAYRASKFFEDGTYMRSQVEGTIARGELHTDELFYQGMANGQPAKSFPADITVDENFLMKGQQLYNRYCSACHAQVGDGNGLVGRRLMIRPTSFHSDYMYDQPPGHFFSAITNGIRTMPAYDKMIPPLERWAITAYVRVLQMSQDIDGAWIKRSVSWWKQP